MMRFHVLFIMGVIGCTLSMHANYFIENSVLNTTPRKIVFTYPFQEKNCKPFKEIILGEEKKVLNIKVPDDCTLVNNPRIYDYKSQARIPIVLAVRPAKRGVWKGYPIYTIIEHNGVVVAQKSSYYVRGWPE